MDMATSWNLPINHSVENSSKTHLSFLPLHSKSFKTVLNVYTAEPKSSQNVVLEEPMSSASSGSPLYLHDQKREGFFMRRFLSVSLLSMGSVIAEPCLASPDSGKVKVGKKSPFNEQRILEQNRRMQSLNSVPDDFPGFVREGYNVKVVTTDKYVKCDSGLLYLDIKEGQGDLPKEGQEVIFHYIGYNESGRRVDSTYQQGRPAKSRLGIKAMIPGFEEGIQSMRVGGMRRIIVPPELGPPVGPSTFFSAKQFEVFDVELLEAKDCTRRTIGFYSDVVCE